MVVQQTDEVEAEVKITPPNYRLQRKLGGAASKLLGPVAYQRAQNALDKEIPLLTNEVGKLMIELELAVQRYDGNARDQIWNTAHEIRGLAGTVGRTSLGVAADLMCRYLDGTDSNFQADPTVLSTIATVANQAVKEGSDEDPMIAKLLSDSARAVAIQRKREGRGDIG